MTVQLRTNIQRPEIVDNIVVRDTCNHCGSDKGSHLVEYYTHSYDDVDPLYICAECVQEYAREADERWANEQALPAPA